MTVVKVVMIEAYVLMVSYEEKKGGAEDDDEGLYNM